MSSPSQTPTGGGRLGVMVAGLDVLGATFIAGALLIRKGILQPAGSVTQMDAPRLAADAGLPPGKLASLLGLARLEDLVFGAWSIFPDTAADVAQVWSLLEPAQFEAVAAEMGAVAPVPAVFNALEVTDGMSGTYIKIKAKKAELVEALHEDLSEFEKSRGCRSVVLFCGSPEAPKNLSPSHASVKAFEAGLQNNDPDITSSQIYAWACAKRGTPFGCAIDNRPIGFPAIEELAASTGAPLAGNGLRQASYRVIDMASPAPHAPGAEAPCWWPEPLRPEVSAEVRESKFAAAIMADRAQMPIEASKRANPPLLDVALLLDAARRRGWAGTQRWLDVFFASPLAPRAPEEEAADFRDYMIRMMKEPSAGPRKI